MPKNLAYVCMTQYDKKSTLPRVLDPEEPQHILAHIIAENSMRNLRVAETEKYAHVTYFFNGGVETSFPGEERILIPSPKVATYDLKPEMSASLVADAVVKAIEGKTFDFIIINFANADMVGHTGNMEAAVQCIEALDTALGRLMEACARNGVDMLVTADHGNAEKMRELADGASDGEMHTAHTSNLVPLVLFGRPAELANDGCLSDIAPTLLALMGLPQPAAMTGHSLAVLRVPASHAA